MIRKTVNYYDTDFSIDNNITIGKSIIFTGPNSIGQNAGLTFQGTNSIAIGFQAGATSQAANSIVISALGSIVTGATANATYIAPIRNTYNSQLLEYNTTTNEITYQPNYFDINGNLDLSCNLIQDVSGIYFCDGTYIGQGSSFDISANQELHISSNGNITIDPSNTLLVDGTLDMSFNNITRVSNIANTGNITINPSNNLTLRTNSIDRLAIDSSGAWTINSSTGTSGQYLTSAGAGATPTWTTFDPYFAQYINTGNQALSASTATDISFNTNVYQNGITRSGSVISFNKAGTYKVGVSLLVEESGFGSPDFYFSFTDNLGVIPNSGSVFEVRGNNAKTLGYAEILYTATASSTIKPVAYTTSSNLTLSSYASPNPAIASSPAVIMTIYQVN